MLLWPTSTSVVTVVRANCTLAGNSLIASETRAKSSSSITESLVRAFAPRMQIVGIHDSSHPGEVLRACTQRAIRSSPLGLTRGTVVALAVVVHLAGSMSRALVLA